MLVIGEATPTDQRPPLRRPLCIPRLRTALVALAVLSCGSPKAPISSSAAAVVPVSSASVATDEGEVAPGQPVADEDIPTILGRGWSAFLAGRTEEGLRILRRAVAEIERTPDRGGVRGRVRGRGADQGVLVDGTHLAVLQANHQLLLVDVATHVVEAIDASAAGFGFLRAVPGQPLVAVMDGRTLRVLEVKPRTLAPVASWPSTRRWAVARDGELLLVERDGGNEAIAWDTRARKEISRTPLDDPWWFEPVDRNRLLLVGANDHATTIAVELGTGRELFVQAGSPMTGRPAFSSDDRWVAYVAPPPESEPTTTVVLADRAGKELARSRACPAPISSVAFDPGGPLLAVSGPASVCFLEAPSLRVVSRAIPVKSPSSSDRYDTWVWLDNFGGRFLFAYGPNDDGAAIIELPSRRVVHRGYASLHANRDGTKYIVSRMTLMPDTTAGAQKWTVDPSGALVREPHTGPIPGMPSDPYSAPSSVIQGARLGLCWVNEWLVPKQACDP